MPVAINDFEIIAEQDDKLVPYEIDSPAPGQFRYVFSDEIQAKLFAYYAEQGTCCTARLFVDRRKYIVIIKMDGPYRREYIRGKLTMASEIARQ